MIDPHAVHGERPWGSWTVLDVGEGYKIKRLDVTPHKRLSYQYHAHRAELWIVVHGTATCTVDGRTVVAQPGDCVEIGVGVAHRIANDHDEALSIIEVQRGSYTGEDDIVRLEDDFGRVPEPS
jgi:mannose-6-phosphate isomerase-like protein (cupin superfamily)